jgi:hypothetical protein
LDRGVASPEWCKAFGEATVEHICTSRSDHAPLLLRFGARKERRPVRKTFRYEAMWEHDDSLAETVSSTWKTGGTEKTLSGIASKLNTMKDMLGRWAQKQFGSVQNSIKSLRSQLQKLRLLPLSPDVENRIKKTEKELDEWLL